MMPDNEGVRRRHPPVGGFARAYRAWRGSGLTPREATAAVWQDLADRAAAREQEQRDREAREAAERARSES